MIRADAVTDLRPLDALLTFTRHPEVLITRVARVEMAEAPTLLSLLSEEAPAREGKWGGWSTNKQADARARAYYFQAIKDGRIRTSGGHYTRTHRLAQGYRVSFFLSGLETFIEVRNTENKAYRWTKGKRQIPGHAATGWKRDAETIQRWMPGFRVRLSKGIAVAIRALGKPGSGV